ncbi:MAG: hypothetical protein JWN17_2864 [Frankiales bacterium]|nr:hypothetical protein [Frankiales bacterium]
MVTWLLVVLAFAACVGLPAVLGGLAAGGTGVLVGAVLGLVLFVVLAVALLVRGARDAQAWWRRTARRDRTGA